jgi:uncharacterized lipoprotein
MLILRRFTLLLVLFAMSACSGVEQKRQVYLQSESIAPLEIPEGLTTPQSNEALPLPQVNPLAELVDSTPPVNLPDEPSAESGTPSVPEKGDTDNDN